VVLQEELSVLIDEIQCFKYKLVVILGNRITDVLL